MTDAERFRFLVKLARTYGVVTIRKQGQEGFVAYIYGVSNPAPVSPDPKAAVDALRQRLEEAKRQEVIDALEGTIDPPF